MRFRLPIPIASLIVISFAPVGCRPTCGVTPLASAAPIASRSDQIVSLQRSLAYREAVRRYRNRDYRGALAQLDRLLARPNLTESDRGFLLRQRAICESKLTKPSPSAPRSQSGARPARSAEQADCGPRALALVCRKLGVPASVEELCKLAGTTGAGTTLEGLANAARAKGLQAEGVQMDKDALMQLNRPAIAWVDGDHYLTVLSVEDDQTTVHDPNKPREEVIETDELLRRSGGILLTVSR